MQNKRKLLLYRSWHRGCKETDILLGKFAQENIFIMTDDEISEYNEIVDMDDVQLYRLLVAGINDKNSALINKIILFNESLSIKQ